MALEKVGVIVVVRRPAHCSELRSFVTELRARSQLGSFDGTLPVAFEVGIETHLTGDTIEGILRLTSSKYGTSVRRLTGQSCDELLSALALIAAISIDYGDEGPSKPAIFPPDPEPVPKPSPNRDIRRAHFSEKINPPKPKQNYYENRGKFTSSATNSFLSIEGTINVDVGVAPKPELGFGFRVQDLGNSFGTRFSFQYLKSPEESTQYGDMTFSRGAFQIGTCYNIHSTSRRWVFGPCIGVELGWLHAAGTAAKESHDTTIFLGGVTPVLQLSRVFRPIAITAEWGLAIPFSHDRFYFGPGINVVHKIPWVTQFFALGVGWTNF